MLLLFYTANIFALFCWIVLIFTPKSKLAQRLSVAVWPFVLLTIYYSLNLAQTLLTWYPGATLADFFAHPNGLYAGWTHYLVVDLFIGQYIYRRTQHFNWAYVLNQLLVLAAAPLGLIVYCSRQLKKP